MIGALAFCHRNKTDPRMNFARIFPQCVPLFILVVGINMANSWLLPVMKTAAGAALGRRPHLAFFQSNILDLARRCATNVAGASDKASYDSWVVGLWSLFPCFCQNPVDIASRLDKLTPTLVKAMEDKRYPQILVRYTYRCLEYHLVPEGHYLYLTARLHSTGTCLYWS